MPRIFEEFARDKSSSFLIMYFVTLQGTNQFELEIKVTTLVDAFLPKCCCQNPRGFPPTAGQFTLNT